MERQLSGKPGSAFEQHFDRATRADEAHQRARKAEERADTLAEQLAKARARAEKAEGALSHYRAEVVS